MIQHALVIDDDIDFRDMLKEMLASWGIQVSTLCNGSNALAELKSSEFDLVLTDIIMPDKEGIETILEIRKEFPELRIIAMTAGGIVEPGTYLKVATKCGADCVLRKPFSSPQLRAAISGLLGEQDGALPNSL